MNRSGNTGFDAARKQYVAGVLLMTEATMTEKPEKHAEHMQGAAEAAL
jgi:hypothetical protein